MCQKNGEKVKFMNYFTKRVLKYCWDAGQVPAG